MFGNNRRNFSSPKQSKCKVKRCCFHYLKNGIASVTILSSFSVDCQCFLRGLSPVFGAVSPVTSTPWKASMMRDVSSYKLHYVHMQYLPVWYLSIIWITLITAVFPSTPLFMLFRCSTAFSILTVPTMPTTPIISFTAPVPFTMLPIPVLIPVSLAWSVSAHISMSASLISSPVSLRSFGSPAIAGSTTWRKFISVAEFIAWIVIHMQEVTVLASRASVSFKETCKKYKKVIRIEKRTDACPGCLRCFFLACSWMVWCQSKADRSSVKGWSYKWRSHKKTLFAFCAGHYKGLTATRNCAWKVSGTQGKGCHYKN